MGSYGKDIKKGLGLLDLVSAILAYTDIPRVRLSSLEPWEIDQKFFSLWENPRLLPHLHVPLQSGSDRILRRMARRTTRTNFRELVTWARDAIPDLNLSTDLIVGFPGETEDDFRISYDFVREIGFSRLHVFSYSKRPGTVAAEMMDQVASSTIKKRMGRMLKLGQELSTSYHKRYEGKTFPVLWEYAKGASGSGLKWVGYTDNYIRVTGTGPADLFNKVTQTRLESANAAGTIGVILGLNGQSLSD
jgi:threonylcarbamoyladenosine tRNA methylthiotransferase MtaB